MSNRRREVRFEEMFPWEIAAAMAEAPLCYLPLGTLEWHGEHAAGGETSLLLALRPDLDGKHERR
jgi:creatinine amidohydrolase